MDARQFVIGTLVGGAVLFAAGYLMYAMAFGNFYIYAMNAGSATGVPREWPVMWAVGLGELSQAALVTLAIGSRAGSLNARAGIRIGAIVGFLLWLTADFMLYGISYVGNLTTAIVDPLLELVLSAIAGGVIAVVLANVR